MQVNGKHEARDSLKATASSDALAGIELGKKPSVCIPLLNPDGANSSKRFLDVIDTKHPDTVHLKFCGCFHTSYRDESTRQIQATKCRT